MNEMLEYIIGICNQIYEESQNKNNFRKNELPDTFAQLREDGEKNAIESE